MKHISFLALALTCLFSFEALAQTSGGVPQGSSESWRREDGSNVSILQTIQDSTGSAGIRNITNAEQVYCYIVDNIPAGYTGYTINNLAVKSFCGTLEGTLRDVLSLSLLVDESSFSPQPEQCVIKPRLMFRFIRGVDSTDIMLSAPCYSLTIYYGGKFKIYNFYKGYEIIDELISIFTQEENITPFVSPAAMGQMTPIGIEVENLPATNAPVSRPTTPSRSWDQKTPPAAPASKPSSGWNNLNI